MINEERLAAHVREIADSAPPLTAHQRMQLAVLLNPPSVDTETNPAASIADVVDEL